MSNSDDEDEPKLPFTWRQIQSAIWLVGLAVLFYTGNLWPGILILVAVSGLFQAAAGAYLSRQEEAQTQTTRAAELEQARTSWLPAVCPKCGAPISAKSVHWTGPASADCPYCTANLTPEK